MAKKKSSKKKQVQPGWYAVAALVATAVVVLGLFTTPIVFADRIAPGLRLGVYDLSGVSEQDLDGVLDAYEQQLQAQEVTVDLDGIQATYSLQELGIALDKEETKDQILRRYRPIAFPRVEVVQPVLHVSQVQAHGVLHQEYATQLDLPRNATLFEATGGVFQLVRGAPGEQVDTLALLQDVQEHVSDVGIQSKSQVPIQLRIISSVPPVEDSEVEDARRIAQQLLQNGFVLVDKDAEYEVKQFTLRRLMKFSEKVDPSNPSNVILGVELDPKQLTAYLETTLQPEVNQEPIDAKFKVEEDEALPEDVRVTQFAVPQVGRTLNLEKTADNIAQAINAGRLRTALVVEELEPAIAQASDLTELGITTLLARGESDFAGSPNNRIHNIRVGASKYHGLLVAPGEEFSFNKYLGPVTASGGFKPELVIKQNVTVPEFGGGLCQVSTTAFRAATFSGMEVTSRRNHSYAVSYYGTPGFDATIYPGYTDFRFLNNTPGHILIQTEIVGTKLIFEFWGTDDGREVEVVGPNPYNRQPDGAVKATLTQKVTKDGEVVHEDTFYSNYKSPKLFPKAVAENKET